MTKRWFIKDIPNEEDVKRLFGKFGDVISAAIVREKKGVKSRGFGFVEMADEEEAKAAIRVIEVVQPGVDTEARWVKKDGKSVFGYKQHTLVDNNGLMLAVETTAANQHDSKPLLPYAR